MMPPYEARLIYETIPGAPGAHGSTVCQLADGRLMAAWYAGSHEGHGDVAIYGAYQSAPGRAWGPPLVLEKTPDLSEGNPVLHPGPDGTVTLFWVTMYGKGWSSCRVKMRGSVGREGERAWERERVFADELGYMTRNKPLVMSNGELLLPLYDEREWQSFVAWSSDGGYTWGRSDLIRSTPGNIQPTIVETAPGRLVCLMRHQEEDGHLWRTESSDCGRTWAEPTAMDLPNPNSAADMARLPNGTIVLAFNDTGWGRTPLTVALSEDDGRTFPIRRNVEEGPGEYSYPAIIATREGRLELTYTHLRETIKHVTFTEAWVRGEA